MTERERGWLQWCSAMLSVVSAVVLITALVWLVIGVTSKMSPADVRAECEGHGGVAQIEPRIYNPGKDKALVVCRDGWVGGVAR